MQVRIFFAVDLGALPYAFSKSAPFRPISLLKAIAKVDVTVPIKSARTRDETQ